jgi:uncharacterized protein (TIGR03435 family)
MNSTKTLAPHELDAIHDGSRVRGGPDWAHSEKYTILAIGDSTDAPTLQGPMLLDLLESRFKLKLRVETEEIPVYALTIAPGGLKMKALESVNYEELRRIRASFDLAPRPSRAPDPNSNAKAAYSSLLGCSFLTEAVRNDPLEWNRYREAVRRGVQPPECFNSGFSFYGPNFVIAQGGSPISAIVESLRSNATQLAPPLPSMPLSNTLDGLLVVDRTGLPDTNCLIEAPPAGTPCAPLFHIVVEHAIDDSYYTTLEQRSGGSVTAAQMGADLSLPRAPSIFNALEKLGLLLKKDKASREFIVIEHIERPSPN